MTPWTRAPTRLPRLPRLARLARLDRCHQPRRLLVTVAIESSCDDSAVAILETRTDDWERFDGRPFARLAYNGRVTANNNRFGGIHPLVALSSHQTALAQLVKDAIRSLPDATPQEKEDGRAIPLLPSSPSGAGQTRMPPSNGLWKRKPDFVSVTRGPGMRSNLATGLEVAKGLSVAWDVPMVGVNHMLAHLLTPRLEQACQLNTENPSAYPSEMDPGFPLVSLLVSGGHTLLVYSPSLDKHLVVAETGDIAAGDCIDKIARLVLPPDMLANRNPSQSPGACLTEFALAGMDLAQWKHSYQPQATSASLLKGRPHPHYHWTLNPPFSDSKGGSRRNALEFSFSGLTANLERLVRFKWDTSANRPSKDPRPESELTIEERRAMALEAIRVIFEHIASRLVLGLDHIKEYQNLDRKAESIRSYDDYRNIARELQERGLRRKLGVGPNNRATEVEGVDDGPIESAHLNLLERRALAKADAARKTLDASGRIDQEDSTHAPTQTKATSSGSLDASAIIVSGGVAANECFRHILETTLSARGYGDIRILAPAPEFCTDNAAMVAWTGFEMYQKGMTSSLGARPIRKWHLGPAIEAVVSAERPIPDDATVEMDDDVVGDAMEAPSMLQAKL